jgi:hypothetical protein
MTEETGGGYLSGLPKDQQDELTRVNAPGLAALREYLSSGGAMAFLGAGVSRPLYPLWDGLIGELVDAAADRLTPKEAATCRALAHDSPEAVVEIVRRGLGPGVFREVLRRVLQVRTDPRSGRSWTPVQELVCRCPFKAVVTTNYDPGIVDARMRVRPAASATGFMTWEDELGLDRWRTGDVFGDAELPVLFAHGQHNRPDSVVLATTEYRRAYAGKLPHVLEVAQEGPAGGEFGRLLDGTLREVLADACQLPHAGLVVLTSRFPFADLETFDGASARMLEVPPFTPAEGAALLAAAGGDWLPEEERQGLVAAVDGHALAVSVLAGLLAGWLPATDLAALRADLAAAARTDARVGHVLGFYADRLAEPDRYLLAAVSLFARPVGAEAVLAVAAHEAFGGRLAGWTPEATAVDDEPGLLFQGRDAADAALRLAARHHLPWHQLDALRAHAELDQAEGIDCGWAAKAEALRARLLPPGLGPDPLGTVERLAAGQKATRAQQKEGDD